MKDLIGQKFGRLTVLGLDYIQKYIYPNGKVANIYYLKCQCECGKICSIRKSKLMNGYTRSCGCLRKETTAKNKPATTHGLHKTRLYETWHHMKQRCYDKNIKGYKNYGGRGITVCEEWKNDFKKFYDWAMQNGYTEELTIDRIDNNGNYEPSNCRWVTIKIQNRNTRANRNITYNDETHCLVEWAEILNIKKETLATRLGKLKWSIEKAFKERVRKKEVVR